MTLAQDGALARGAVLACKIHGPSGSSHSTMCQPQSHSAKAFDARACFTYLEKMQGYSNLFSARKYGQLLGKAGCVARGFPHSPRWTLYVDIVHNNTDPISGHHGFRFEGRQCFEKLKHRYLGFTWFSFVGERA